MDSAQRRHGRHVNQYSAEYHLSRGVRCLDCGVQLHRSHFYHWYGNRCRPCYQAATASGNTQTPRS